MPEWLDGLMLRGLAKDPAGRPPSALESGTPSSIGRGYGDRWQAAAWRWCRWHRFGGGDLLIAARESLTRLNATMTQRCTRSGRDPVFVPVVFTRHPVPWVSAVGRPGQPDRHVIGVRQTSPFEIWLTLNRHVFERSVAKRRNDELACQRRLFEELLSAQPAGTMEPYGSDLERVRAVIAEMKHAR